MTGHPVLDDPDFSDAFDLIRHDGTEIKARGRMALLDERAADIRKVYSTVGRQVWIGTDRALGEQEIEFVRADGRRYRVLATVNLAGPHHRSARLQLQSFPAP